MQGQIQRGSRVFLRGAIAGEAGIVLVIERSSALVEWPDMPEIGRPTRHALDTLMLDEGGRLAPGQLGIEFEEWAA
jgi:hypothetical protein